ncbi:Rhodopsin orphan GPCR [Fasciola hepatica]|uniref:Rhodopsin orphan GPCR n=1 Tax=Fasciola hepatica TaxID=6192 RepID=A0A2H1CX26_FASHE|nr:Rhodopsin orphan GPCR [Fasciola hepatica]
MSNSTAVMHVNERYDDVQFAERFAPQILLIERTNFPLWTSIGIPGGIFSMLIWSSRPMRRGGSAAAAVYQTCLGIVDVTFLFVFWTWHLQMSWHMHLLDHPVICEAFPVFYYGAQYLTSTLTFTFTLERFLAICYPFKSQNCLIRGNEQGALKLMAILTAFCLCFSSVQSLIFHFNGKNCDVRPEVNNESDVRYVLYRAWTILTEAVFFFGMPIMCLILNVFVIRVLQRSVSAKRNPLLSVPINGSTDLSNGDADRHPGAVTKGVRSSTLTLLCTSFYLTTVQLAMAITMVIVNFIPLGNPYLTDEEIEKDPTWRGYTRFLTIRALLEAFTLTHYAAKFPIYMATSQQFRHEFCRRFCPCTGYSRQDDYLTPSVDMPMPKLASLQGSRSDLFRANRPLWGSRSSSATTRKGLTHSAGRNLQITDRHSLMSVPSRRRPSPGYLRSVIGPDGTRVPVEFNGCFFHP